MLQNDDVNDDTTDDNDEDDDEETDGFHAGASFKGSQLLHISKSLQPGGDAINLWLKSLLVHISWREIFVSSDRSSYSDDGLVYIQVPLFGLSL